MRIPLIESNTKTIHIKKEQHEERSERKGKYYWSTHPGSRHVYHTCRKCTEGNNIEKSNFESGNNPPSDYRKCEKCDLLKKAGRC